jgi:hypothetical protein
MDPASAPLEFALTTHTDRFDGNDERWLVQQQGLLADLRREVPVRSTTAPAPAPGEKGTVETVLVAMGSAGTFTAVAECFKAWLGRDRSRHLELVTSVDGREEKFVLTGEGINDAEFDRLAEFVRKRAGDRR